MNSSPIELIPISEINIVNSRPRNKLMFDMIVGNIAAIGLKKPITVSRRPIPSNGFKYDLVCGQGRLEAFLALGEKVIPAIIIEATRESQYLMSLVENIARRPPSNRDLLREVRALKGRGYKTEEIASKLGLDRVYTFGIVKLLEQGEDSLIEAVEGRRIPVTVAITIANGTNEEVRRALTQAYEKGDLRGAKLTAARSIIAKRLARAKKGTNRRSKVSARSLVKEYHRHAEKSLTLIRRAAVTNERLLLLVSIVRRLFADENFITLLRAESVDTIPEFLATALKSQ